MEEKEMIEMSNEELHFILTKLSEEHNRMATIIDFLVNNLIDRKVINLNDLTKFLNDSGNFDSQFFKNEELPPVENVLENIEKELNI